MLVLSGGGAIAGVREVLVILGGPASVDVVANGCCWVGRVRVLVVRVVGIVDDAVLEAVVRERDMMYELRVAGGCN